MRKLAAAFLVSGGLACAAPPAFAVDFLFRAVVGLLQHQLLDRPLAEKHRERIYEREREERAEQTQPEGRQEADTVSDREQSDPAPPAIAVALTQSEEAPEDGARSVSESETSHFDP